MESRSRDTLRLTNILYMKYRIKVGELNIGIELKIYDPTTNEMILII